jgi:hypothetical protein
MGDLFGVADEHCSDSVVLYWVVAGKEETAFRKTHPDSKYVISRAFEDDTYWIFTEENKIGT